MSKIVLMAKIFLVCCFRVKVVGLLYSLVFDCFLLFSRWKIPTAESRKEDLERLNAFRATLSLNTTDEKKHSAELEFMAENGLRQLGEPRIGLFANRQRPEPLHLEINNWEHATNLLYQETVRRGLLSHCFLAFPFSVLRDSITNNGCGLASVAKKH